MNVTWPVGPRRSPPSRCTGRRSGYPILKKVHGAAGNAAGNAIDSTPDASLTTNVPPRRYLRPDAAAGQVNPGAATLPVAAAATFLPGGGWVVLGGGQVVRYSGDDRAKPDRHPARRRRRDFDDGDLWQSGDPAPMLVGVTGLTVPLMKGAAIHLWIQRDDLLAQAEQRARAGGDGVIEHVLVDMRRGLASLTARCDADLARFSRPLVTVTYATRDLKTRSGKTVAVDLASPRIQETLTIQDVTITEIDQVPEGRAAVHGHGLERPVLARGHAPPARRRRQIVGGSS